MLETFDKITILNILAKREDLRPEGKLTVRDIKSGIKLMEQHNMPSDSIKALAWQYLTANDSTDEEKIEMARTISAEQRRKIYKEYNKNPANSIYKIFVERDDIIDWGLKNMSPEGLKAIFDENGKALEVFASHLASLGATIEDVSEKLASGQYENNMTLAKTIKYSPARTLLKSYIANELN